MAVSYPWIRVAGSGENGKITAEQFAVPKLNAVQRQQLRIVSRPGVDGVLALRLGRKPDRLLIRATVPADDSDELAELIDADLPGLQGEEVEFYRPNMDPAVRDGFACDLVEIENDFPVAGVVSGLKPNARYMVQAFIVLLRLTV